MTDPLAMQLLAWLGYWRDSIPAQAVTDLQNILDTASDLGLCGVCGGQYSDLSGHRSLKHGEWL